MQCVVTSPPYWGLRDYGVEGQIGLELTPEAFVATMVEVFHEVKRILRDDGVLWLNLGDSYSSGGRTSTTLQTVRNGNGDASLMTRPPVCEGIKPKDLVGIPWMVALALRADGWYLRSDIIWAKPNPMPESVTDRPTRSHEYLFLLAKSERYYFDADAIRESAVTDGDCRFERTDNTQIRARNGTDSRTRTGMPTNGRNKRDVWTINSEPTPEAHFATFPQKLIEPCILAGSRVGDVVFDPFLGSGTVGVVCERFGRRWVGTELSTEYIKIARKRTAQQGLFANQPVKELNQR